MCTGSSNGKLQYAVAEQEEHPTMAQAGAAHSPARAPAPGCGWWCGRAGWGMPLWISGTSSACGCHGMMCACTPCLRLEDSWSGDAPVGSGWPANVRELLQQHVPKPSRPCMMAGNSLSSESSPSGARGVISASMLEQAEEEPEGGRLRQRHAGGCRRRHWGRPEAVLFSFTTSSLHGGFVACRQTRSGPLYKPSLNANAMGGAQRCFSLMIVRT